MEETDRKPRRENERKNYFKGMVVREPFGRLWSAYNDKFVNMNYKFIRTYQRVQHVLRKTNITVGVADKNCQKHVEFEDFIKYISWEHFKSRTTPPILTGEPISKHVHLAMFNMPLLENLKHFHQI